MDFLEETNNTNTIEVWVEERGRRSDTYVSGWNINDTKLKENLRDNVVETKKGKEFEKLIKFLEGLNIESDTPILNNFSEYYDYFIKKGVDQQYLDEINKYISEVGNITISENDLCGIQSIDEYLENRSEDKFEDFANFYELLQENSIEKNGII
jgi:hypothetical protein